jgi:hypothetical protein
MRSTDRRPLIHQRGKRANRGRITHHNKSAGKSPKRSEIRALFPY